MCITAVTGMLTEDGAEYIVNAATADSLEKARSQLWFIHGKAYDLASFLNQHPGGKEVLLTAMGLEDVTALFESYHALANTDGIRTRLEAYRFKGKVIDDLQAEDAAMMRGIKKSPITYTYKKGGFYDVLKTRIKLHFLDREKGAAAEAAPTNGAALRAVETVSVIAKTKVNFLWYLKEVAIVAFYLPLYLTMLGVDLGMGMGSPPLAARLLCGFLAGALLMCFSFCTLHDSSHHGLWYRRPKLQSGVSRVCNALTGWNHGIWALHHVYGHHSFTGDPMRDPDLIHARPFIRKSGLSPLVEYFRYFIERQHIIAPVFFTVIPGQSLGQSISYYRGATQGHVWRVPLRPVALNMRWYEIATYAIVFLSNIWGANIFASFVYLMGINTAYHFAIVPDHDTFESAVTNQAPSATASDSVSINGSTNGHTNGTHADVNGAAAEHEGVDWGEIQVRHSGNFSMSSSMVTQMWGGINYQIEHHLFPSMSHMHYWHIAPVVMQTCQEFGIPYNAHPTLWSAYKSYLKTLRHFGPGAGGTKILQEESS